MAYLRSNLEQEIQKSENQVTLKELIGYIRLCWLEFWNRKWLIIFTAFIGAVIGFRAAVLTPKSYKASYRFFVKEGGASNLGSSIGTLGSLLGGAGGTLLDKTSEVINSQMVVEKVLLSTIEIDGKSDLVINHYYKIQDFQREWEDEKSLSTVRFSTADTVPDLYNSAQRKVYKLILTRFTNEKSSIIQHSFEKKTGVFSMSVNNKNEEFSIKVSSLMLDGIRRFIKSYTTESLNNNVTVLNKKVDSIKSELHYVRKKLAKATDQSFSVFLNEDKVDLKTLAAQEQILLAMYVEAQKNLETILFMGQSASNAAAVIVLDRPYSPIRPIQKSILNYTIAGFFILGFVSFGLILFLRWFKKNIIL
jgi:uncharacterized protein involved in exopolysaccharide biosynthesis